ncbi:hypothetical protein SLNHY_5397 [Streptomyces albus]|nr:hypothetical protein SLNHY_5397 [Streptomyces albus]
MRTGLGLPAAPAAGEHQAQPDRRRHRDGPRRYPAPCRSPYLAHPRTPVS